MKAFFELLLVLALIALVGFLALALTLSLPAF